jgi:uncharacterized protein YndB with AHSA1/START domain
MASETDRIEKKILLRASRARVWRALTDTKEFCTWFGVRFDAPFAAGKALRGTLVGTSVDADIAEKQREHDKVPFDVTVDRIEPEHLFSFRWHPGAVEPGVDYASEPTTLVVFALAEAEGGVLLTVTESGFDALPAGRRAAAFSGNAQGWDMVAKLIETHLARAA